MAFILLSGRVETIWRAIAARWRVFHLQRDREVFHSRVQMDFNLNCMHREGCHCFDDYVTRATVQADATQLREAIEENERMRREVVDKAALSATVQYHRARLAIADPEVAYCRKHHRNYREYAAPGRRIAPQFPT